MTTDGLILSAKSIGTTHITNAAYRMHPVEWAIGEASGFLAVFLRLDGRKPTPHCRNPTATAKAARLHGSQRHPHFLV